MYRTIALSIPPDEARTEILGRVDGVQVTESGESYQLSTNSGVYLASLDPATVGGERGTKLRYRTTMISPALRFAQRKAREIRDAVSQYRVDERERSGGGASR